MNDFLNSEKHLFNHINDTSGCIDGINGGTLVTNKFIKYMNTKFLNDNLNLNFTYFINILRNNIINFSKRKINRGNWEGFILVIN
jgi:hypothetical protein